MTGSDAGAPRIVRLLLRYDGTAYSGWQRQADRPTVQAAIEDALATILAGETPVVHGSGRTDAGVHALGQVAHFETSSRLDAPTIRRALNARLPHDVAVAGACDERPGFHARFSAVRKTYVYRFAVGDSVDPFLRGHALHLFRRPDVAAMRAVASALVGRHDFRSFCAEARDREDTVRTLFALRVREGRHDLRVFATADGFLQHMVRALAGALLKAGRGDLSVDRAREILAAGDRPRAPAALPAHGLYLWKVDYATRGASPRGGGAT